MNAFDCCCSRTGPHSFSSLWNEPSKRSRRSAASELRGQTNFLWILKVDETVSRKERSESGDGGNGWPDGRNVTPDCRAICLMRLCFINRRIQRHQNEIDSFFPIRIDYWRFFQHRQTEEKKTTKSIRVSMSKWPDNNNSSALKSRSRCCCCCWYCCRHGIRLKSGPQV